MTNKEALHDLKAIKDYFITECDASPMCLDYAIKALEQESCEDAVSRKAVLDYIKGSEAELGHSTENNLVCEDIMALPSVKPKRKYGEWINAKVGKLFPSNDYKCSKCGNILDFNGVNCGRGDANFCPNCGADMRGEK